MGFLGILLALYVGHVYQNMAVDNQRLAYEELLRLRVGDRLLALEKNTTALGQSIQNNEEFRDALAKQNKVWLTTYLKSYFQQYIVSAGEIRLYGIHALNSELDVVGSSYDYSDANQYNRVSGRSCERLVQQAKTWAGTQRFKKISAICMDENLPAHHVLIPIGDFNIGGYLELVTDPTHSMIAIEDDLGLPVKITLSGSNSIAYQSPGWTERVDQRMNIVAGYDYTLPSGQDAFRVSIVRNISAYREALTHKRNTLMLTACVLTLLVAMLMLYVLKKTTLDPLNFLARQIRKLRDGSSQLGTTISLQGITEVEDLADSYNQMTLELKSLYDELQQKNADLNNENHERQKAEAELKKGKDNLEGLIEKRTVDLAIARDTAIKASHSKSLFLANMSHELRTPLNAIIGYTEILLEDVVRDEKIQYQQDLNKVYSAGQHLLALVKDVLDLSKIEAGRMELEIDNFKIIDFISDLQNTAIPLVAKNHNTLSIVMNDTLGDMSADITKLRQSVLNLLSNAAKFTEHGQISLSIRRLLVQQKEMIEFTVTDTGIGLSDDQQDKQSDLHTSSRF
jgi:signal transduction histidine kinase